MNEILQSAIDEAKRNAESVHTGWSCTLLAYVEEVEAAALDARNAREAYKRGNTQIIIERERYYKALENIADPLHQNLPAWKFRDIARDALLDAESPKKVPMAMLVEICERGFDTCAEGENPIAESPLEDIVSRYGYTVEADIQHGKE